MTVFRAIGNRRRRTSRAPLDLMLGAEPAGSPDRRRPGWPRRRGECRHCRRDRCLERLDLCYRCYSDRAVRARYESPTRMGRARAEGYRDHQHDLPLPGDPTPAPPGSQARVEVMRQRFARGEHIRHPGDPTCFGRRND